MTDLYPPLDELAQRIGIPLPQWHHQCHVISIALVKARVWPGSRVARGTARGVPGQHSWIILDRDPYAPGTRIVDPTLWTYLPGTVGLHVGAVSDRTHRAKGHGPHVMAAGRPPYPTETPVPLSDEARAGLSPAALDWVDGMLGPLDRRGWMELAESTMIGWPAGEIMRAMHETPELSAFVPIDILGMLTDLNPHGLYLAAEDTEADAVVST